MRQEGEPSVDQILRSIKRVMAREPRSVPPAEEQGFEARYGEDASGEMEGMSEHDGGAGGDGDGGGGLPPEPTDPEEALELVELSGPDLPRHPSWDETGAGDGAAFDAGDDLIENEADGEGEADGGAEGEGDDPQRSDDQAQEAGSPAPSDDGDQAGDDPERRNLTSDGATASMRDSLAALAMLSQPGAPLPTSAAGAASLDTLVREMLRPMLANWLETNLPAIVEREVRAEIGRIAGNSGATRAP